MAQKKLLTEAQVRSFMKLANIGPVGENRIQEWTYDTAIEEQEDELEMDAEEEGQPGEMGGLPDMDAEGGLEMDDELGDDDMEMDAELGAPDDLDAGIGGDKETEFMDLVQQLADLVGVEVDMEGGAEGEDMPGDEEAADLEGGEEAGEELPPMGDEEEAGEGLPPMGDEEEEEELPGMRDVYEGKDKLVNEVAGRVIARLTKEDQNNKMVDDLAERIFNRLTSK